MTGPKHGNAIEQVPVPQTFEVQSEFAAEAAAGTVPVFCGYIPARKASTC